jgi:hypothetical protein
MNQLKGTTERKSSAAQVGKYLQNGMFAISISETRTKKKQKQKQKPQDKHN